MGCCLWLFSDCCLSPLCQLDCNSCCLLGRHRRVLSLLSCTSAGIFLGAGFMHMTAEALEGIESEIQKLVIQVSSRVAELQGCEARMLNRTRESNEAKDTGGTTGKMTALARNDGNRSDWPLRKVMEPKAQDRKLSCSFPCLICAFFSP